MCILYSLVITVYKQPISYVVWLASELDIGACYLSLVDVICCSDLARCPLVPSLHIWTNCFLSALSLSIFRVWLVSKLVWLCFHSLELS